MTAPPLILGITGRVGRLIRPALPDGVRVAQRGPGPGLAWDLAAGPRPLLDLAARDGPPAALVVLAGVTPATGADMAANVGLARAALAAARQAGVRRVLLASSSAVYGGPRPEPWREEDPAQPRSAYGAAKLAMEEAARPFRDAGLEVSALRIGNVAGADALLLNAPGPVRIDRFADGGGPVRSYIGPATLARVLTALCGLSLPPVLNLAAPRPVAMADLARAADLRWSWTPAPPAAAQHFTLACDRLAQAVPFADTDSAPAAMIAQWRACQRTG